MDPSTVSFPPDCEAVIRALWAYLDDEVPEDSLEMIVDHLERCEYCRAHAEFEKRLVAEIAGLRRRHSNLVELRARVLDTLRQAGFSGP